LTSETASTSWLARLEASGLGVAMRQWLWLYPGVEIVHIAGFVVLVGAAAMFDLRLLGLSRRLPVAAMAVHLLPWARAGLAIVVPTGLMMFVAHATEMATNPVFRIKLVLIAAALANAAAFHRWPFRSVSRWDVEVQAPAAARLAAGISLVLWISVISCGRLLAYF
jgi:hypothetical protein